MPIKPGGTFYALYGDGELISCLSLTRQARSITIDANWTVPAQRRHGYFTLLLQAVIDTLGKDHTLTAEALDASRAIYRRLGFSEGRSYQLKHSAVTTMRRPKTGT